MNRKTIQTLVLTAACAAVAAHAQTIADDPSVFVTEGAPMQHRMPVRRPTGVDASGTVQLQATLNGKGEVTDVRVLSGPDELRKTAITSVLDWHYRPGPAVVTATIEFVPAAQVRRSGVATAAIEGGPIVRTAIGVATPQAPPPPPPPPPPPAGAISMSPGAGVSVMIQPAGNGGFVNAPVAIPGGRGPTTGAAPPTITIAEIQINGLPADAERELRSKLPVRPGDSMDLVSLLGKVTPVVHDFDSHLIVNPLGRTASGETALAITAPGWYPAAPPQPNFAPAEPGVQRIRVGGNVQSNNLTSKATPSYPPLAKQARIQGTVRINALIGRDGAIKDLLLESGHPLLAPAALDAVHQWTYKPTLLNGNPVEVITTIDVNFTLAQ